MQQTVEWKIAVTINQQTPIVPDKLDVYHPENSQFSAFLNVAQKLKLILDVISL